MLLDRPLNPLFSGWQPVAEAVVGLGGTVEGTREGLEECFDLVMGVRAVERHDMDVDARLAGERVEKVTHQVSLELPNDRR